jgi:hypothetical protein
VLILYQAGIGKNGNEQSLAFQHQVKIRKIIPQKGFAARYETPKRPEGNGLIGNKADFLQCQFILQRRLIARREVDVAMTAVVVAAGGDLEVEGQWNPPVPEFVPERKIGQTREGN